MSKVYVIGDIGSCHMGNEDQCIEAVRVGKECGLNAVKYQLGVSRPNINIPVDYFLEAKEIGNKIGIDVFTSIFDTSQYGSDADILSALGHPTMMKFAFSNKSDPMQLQCKKMCIQTIVSCDVLSYYYPSYANVRLFCIPEYPVTKEISFDGLFPMFDGFSDHTMGYRQTLNAVRAGAKYIEKHFKLWEGNRPDSPPDGLFALSPKELQSMVSEIRSME